MYRAKSIDRLSSQPSSVIYKDGTLPSIKQNIINIKKNILEVIIEEEQFGHDCKIQILGKSLNKRNIHVIVTDACPHSTAHLIAL